eukprot:TRINITY_DN2092_c0_g1_i1.p1 TRINITY_DN2092_c0_g1~~TRINITY_DN2092_c0_g1_i1.p1  ORF type:complete len:105 (-),score=21.12 TRINITY_DN2092_c0_g1_i1:98-412(-)
MKLIEYYERKMKFSEDGGEGGAVSISNNSSKVIERNEDKVIVEPAKSDFRIFYDSMKKKNAISVPEARKRYAILPPEEKQRYMNLSQIEQTRYKKELESKLPHD